MKSAKHLAHTLKAFLKVLYTDVISNRLARSN
jgi:hypothetical protein